MFPPPSAVRGDIFVPQLPVMQVPSVVIPQEWNYLVDPEDEELNAGWSVNCAVK
jgi:hypothetical protein